MLPDPNTRRVPNFLSFSVETYLGALADPIFEMTPIKSMADSTTTRATSTNWCLLHLADYHVRPQYIWPATAINGSPACGFDASHGVLDDPTEASGGPTYCCKSEWIKCANNKCQKYIYHHKWQNLTLYLIFYAVFNCLSIIPHGLVVAGFTIHWTGLWRPPPFF